MVGDTRNRNTTKNRMSRTTCVSLKTEIQGRVPAGTAAKCFPPSSRGVFMHEGEKELESSSEDLAQQRA